MSRLLWVLIMIALPASMACGGDDDTDETDERVQTILALTGDATAAQGDYSANCVVCHEADGTGNPSGSDLTIVDLTDEYIVETILYGRGTMAPYENAFNDQEIADLAALVQNF